MDYAYTICVVLGIIYSTVQKCVVLPIKTIPRAGELFTRRYCPLTDLLFKEKSQDTLGLDREGFDWLEIILYYKARLA